MSNNEVLLEVNDYLDLYLYAKSIGDQAWQEEIIHKLQNYNQHPIHQTKVTNQLLAEFKHINKKILGLYQELHTDSFNSYIPEKIMDLKQRRIEITRQLRTQQIHSIETLK